VDSIRVVSDEKFLSTAENLKKKLEQNIEKYQNEITFNNTEASLVWIIRGCIEYFDKLESDFLGEGNVSGIPNMRADHFANNIYRLVNAIDYYSRLWNIDIVKNKEISLLLDIRTLFVHSGEQLTKVKSLELADYKDSQLGRIFKSNGHNPFKFIGVFSDMDYCIEIWNDKHDKSKRKCLAEVDYDMKKENYHDILIYLKAADVRNIMLLYVSCFLGIRDKTPNLRKEVKKLPDIKNRVINEKNSDINFDKIADLVSKDLRGGYIIESGIHHWNGFGLKRLLEYSRCRLGISDKVRDIISERVHNVVSKYWDDYQNDDIPDDELPDLDIRKVFSDFTPKFKLKHYLEGEKLFIHIAPYFNTRDEQDATDINYLAIFINEVTIALGKQLKLEQTVDGLICDYFVQSIQSKIDN